jgi:cytochrome c oxidase subunit 2
LGNGGKRSALMRAVTSRGVGPTIVLLLSGAAAAFAEPQVTTPSVFAPRSTPASGIFDYSHLVLGVCLAIFVLVTALIAVTAIRFRRRASDDDREPPQLYGSNQLELAWTVVPVIIVFVLSLVTVRTILALQIDERPSGWLPVTAVGHQWWWEFEYPEQGFTTANELHVATGRATFLTLRSADVIHSFWVPQLAGKTDVIPSRENHMWIEPTEPGLYVGQCAEYCGTQHAHMLLRVHVHTPEDFERWARAEARAASEDPAVAVGRDLFLSTACINCHTVRGTVANGRFGPDLTHLMSRETLGAGVAPNDPKHLAQWIVDPAHLKPGVLMPAMGLDEQAVDHVVAYLSSLE